MRIALRGPAVGAGCRAAGVRALHAALLGAGADAVLEACDPGGPVTPRDAPPAADRRGPVDVHLQWCAAADVEAGVDAPVRVARISQPHPVTAPEAALLKGLDEVWVRDEAAREHLVSLGVDRERLWVCPDPVDTAGVSAVAPPGAHGAVTLAIEPDPARLMNLVCVWAEVMPVEADVTLVLASDAGLPERVVAALARAGHREVDIADLMLICEPLSDRERLGLIAAAGLVLTPSARIAAEAAALGVPCADLGLDAPALAAKLCRTGERAAHAPSARHDAARVAGEVAARLAGLARFRRASGGYAGRPRTVLEGAMLGDRSPAAVNRGLARAMLRQGRVDLALRDGEGAVPDPAAPVDQSMRPLAWGCLREHGGAPDVTIRHGHPADLSPVRDGRLVAVLPWEFGGAPAEWLECLDRGVDEIWVPTGYVRDGYLAAGAPEGRVAVVPNGVDTAMFHPARAPMDLGDGAPGYRLLHVGGPAWRKGVDLLVDAYRMAFGPDDDVTLVLTDRGASCSDGVDRLVEDLAADPRAPRVMRLTRPVPEGAMPGLYAACDCLVHPYRGEAYGMTMAEAMATGLPVIAPDRGAARAFMDPDTALLVPSRRREIAVAELAGHRLVLPAVVHEVEVEALASRMRWAYECRDLAADTGRRAAVAIAAGHTWHHAAAVAASRLAALTASGEVARGVAA
ncbi:MAG: glycosyltransferase [Thermoleophilia bacterium]|nr:glycosyltransferase [Thermoleophilia bacterium]